MENLEKPYSRNGPFTTHALCVVYIAHVSHLPGACLLLALRDFGLSKLTEVGSPTAPEGPAGGHVLYEGEGAQECTNGYLGSSGSRVHTMGGALGVAGSSGSGAAAIGSRVLVEEEDLVGG